MVTETKTVIKNSESFRFLLQAEQAIAIAEAGLKSIQPSVILAREASYNSATKRFLFGGKRYDMDDYDRIILLGIGAGTSAAIDYLRNILPRLPIKIVVMDPEAEFNPEAGVYSVTYHPTANNAEATNQLLKYAPFSEDDLVIAVTDSTANNIVNAGSDMPPDQQRMVMQALQELQASHEELATVAVHLAEGRGGGLAHLLEPAQVLNYVITDKLNEQGQPIALSPFIQHGSSLYQAKEIIEKYGILVYCNMDSCVFIASEIAPVHKGVKTSLLASPLTWYEYMKLAASEFGLTPEVFVAGGMDIQENPLWQNAESAIALMPETNSNVQLKPSSAVELFLNSGVYKEPAGLMVVPRQTEPHSIMPEVPTLNVGSVGIKLS